MIVEFETVHSDLEESYQRGVTEELQGIAHVPFAHENDYITNITIEMSNVIDFKGGKVWFNGEPRDCVYVKSAIDEGYYWSQNLLMSYQDFKKLFELATGKKVFNHREI
jgi:hypothetical protein